MYYLVRGGGNERLIRSVTAWNPPPHHKVGFTGTCIFRSCTNDNGWRTVKVLRPGKFSPSSLTPSKRQHFRSTVVTVNAMHFDHPFTSPLTQQYINHGQKHNGLST